jgi:outer membrane protein
MNQALRLRYMCASILLVGSSLTTYGQTLSLSSAFQKALQADPAIQAAEQALLAGREKNVQGAALLKPQVALAASVIGINSHAESALPPQFAALAQPDTSGEVREAALQFTQPIYNASASSSKQQLMRQAEAAELSWRAARQDLMMRVTEAYLMVLGARESFSVCRSQSETFAQHRERAQARFDLGTDKITDLHEAAARYDAAFAQEVSARSALELRIAQFYAVTGADTENLAQLDPTISLDSLDVEGLESWQRKAMEQSARISAKSIESSIAQLESRKFTLESRPTLDLIGSYASKSKTGDLSLLISADLQRTATIGLQLKVPLFSGGMLNSRERETLAKFKQSELELAATQRDVRLQTQEAFLGVKTSLARLHALQRTVQSLKTALDATTLARDVGSRTQLDVLEVQQRLYGARLDLTQSRIEILLNRMKLAWVVGELEERDLKTVDKLTKK